MAANAEKTEFSTQHNSSYVEKSIKKDGGTLFLHSASFRRLCLLCAFGFLCEIASEVQGRNIARENLHHINLERSFLLFIG